MHVNGVNTERLSEWVKKQTNKTNQDLPTSLLPGFHLNIKTQRGR